MEMRMLRFWRTAGAATAIAAALFAASVSTEAQAQEFKGKSAGDILVRLRGIGVVPQEEGKLKTRPGNADLATNVNLGNAFVPEIDFSYFVTDNIALELIAATTRHKVDAHGAI